MSVNRVNRGRSTTYRVRYRDETGRQQSKSFKTRKEALEFDAQIRIEKSRGVSTSRRRDRLTFAEIAETWWATKITLRDRSRKRIRGILDKHLLPSIGHLALSKLNRDVIQELVNTWVRQGLEPRTILNHRNVLTPILDMAVADEILHRNPSRFVTYPSPAKVQRTVLAPEDCLALVSACEEPERLIVRIMLATGMRFAEMQNLDISDFAVDARLISVRYSKTPNGVRDISLSDNDVGVIVDSLKQRAQEQLSPDAPLFASRLGKRLDYGNFRRRFEAAVHRAQLDGVTIHDMRRTHATALIAAGVDAKTVQERMGHASVQTTLSIYARATASGLRSASTAMSRYIASAEAQIG
jgi:integrase